MVLIRSRTIPPHLQWQLEQQNLPPLLARIYAGRGITSCEELNYDLKSLLPPTLLTHVEQAAVLLADAIEAQAKILIVADYDCDGATACVLGILAMRAMTGGEIDIDYLVPNRFHDGYGLTPALVDLAAQKNVELIVTVDNGIASLDGVARANELGIAVLITDHHLPAETLPEADCIVNPNQPGCNFPSKNLAGVGVMFYLMLALRAEMRNRDWFSADSGRTEPNLASFLDLVALGTVADVVRLDRNNRLLVNQGLKRIREGRMNEGIRALFSLTGREAVKASSFDLGFVVGPRLNAAGRLSDMSIGIECLLSKSYATALVHAQKLDAFNRERKEIEAGMQEQALENIESLTADDASAVVFFDENWHQGVIGILASRMKDRLHRPVFAFAPGDSGELKGSGRSIAGLHLRDTLDLLSKRAPDLLIRFGGHAMAAGTTIRAVDLERFREMFVALADELLTPGDLMQTLETDGHLEVDYISINTVRLLENEIWGQGFPPPLFDDQFMVESQRVLKEKHLKLRLFRDEQYFDAIVFNYSHAAAERIHAAYRVAINEYNGVETPQLVIEKFVNL